MCIPVPTEAPQNGVEEEVMLINKMPTTRNEEPGLNENRKNVWIADSEASSHMTNNACRLINTRKIQSKGNNW